MPAYKTKYPDVNLMPKDPFVDSGAGKVLSWSLSTGRYIVVFTELVVILTFLSRFTLDRQLSDLNESVMTKSAIMSSYEDVEAAVKAVQQKAQFIETIQDRYQTTLLLGFLTDNAPKDIIFERLEVKSERFSVVGISYSQDSLSRFIEVLKSQQDFADVILDKVNTTEKSAGINFIIRANFAQENETGTQSTESDNTDESILE